MEYNRDSLLDVVRTLFKWKRPIIITCLTVGVLTAVISLLLPNYFEASTTFYAASPDLQSPSVIFGKSARDLEFYGKGEDMDRLIQAANSNDLFNYMTEEFDLYKHYEIDSTKLKSPYKLRTKFNKYFNIKKNERDALILSMEDKDRELSAKMANAAREKINDIANGLIRSSQKEIIRSYESQIKGKEDALSVISDSLTILRNRYGIFDAKYQKEVVGSMLPSLNAEIASEKGKLEVYKKVGRRDSINVITARLAGFEKKLEALTQAKNGLDMSTGISLIGQLSESEGVIMEELGEDRSNYQQYKASIEVPKPALFVQDYAEVPVVKSRPKRSMLVIGAGFLAFLFSVLGVLIIEYNRDVDWKAIVNGK